MSRKSIVIATFAAVFLLPVIALAAPGVEEAPKFILTTSSERGLFAFAAAFAIGLAALGGGMGQGRAVAAALEGICRNPNSAGKVLVPMLLGLAFIESLVIFALIIAFQAGGFVTLAVPGSVLP
ncbi:MAG: ATP synthase F0 subunit C [Myxococcales bacterium]|nr:ATP synthase F0 subunit C [Myxococcales bacterium]MCB9750211.1 ATP synthase F0 subunit C [Myxococcales bacterium]